MIIRSYFYRWQGCLKRHGLAGLEDRSRRPLNVRRGMTGPEVMEEIRKIRRKNPTYSAKKIRPILLRFYEEREVPSVSNIIKRHNLFFRADTRAFKRRSRSAMRAAGGSQVRTPKDKPCVERMIETLQTECLDYLSTP